MQNGRARQHADADMASLMRQPGPRPKTRPGLAFLRVGMELIADSGFLRSLRGLRRASLVETSFTVSTLGEAPASKPAGSYPTAEPRLRLTLRAGHARSMFADIYQTTGEVEWLGLRRPLSRFASAWRSTAIYRLNSDCYALRKGPSAARPAGLSLLAPGCWTHSLCSIFATLA